MGKKKFTKEELLDAIKSKFGSVEELAALMNTSRANLYEKIERQSGKFLHQLEEHGVKLPDTFVYAQLGNIQQSGSGIVGVTGENVSIKVKRIEELEKELDALRKDIISKDKLISTQEKLIKNYEKQIEEMEEELLEYREYHKTSEHNSRIGDAGFREE